MQPRNEVTVQSVSVNKTQSCPGHIVYLKSEIKQPEQREREGVKRATIFTVHCFLIAGDGSVRLYVQKAFLIRGGHGMRLIDGIIFNLEKHAMTDKKHKTEVRFLEGLKGVEHVRSGGNRI